MNEEEAWREVLARWDDDSSHREYLDRFSDLEGLALAGRRYRAALEARPGDAAAMRWREEVLKRAAVQGLAQLPRTRPPLPLPRSAKLALAALAVSLAASLLWFAGSRLAQAFGAWRKAGP